MRNLAGRLIAVEGIDQAGKWTICDRLTRELRAHGVPAEMTGFPDYTTPLGEEIRRVMAGERTYPAQARQLLYAANRWERASDLRAWLADGRAVVLDRYIASGIAYGSAQGLDPGWMLRVEEGLPPADLTILLDIPPEVSVSRKSADRDAYEAQTELLARARDAYLRVAEAPTWRVVDATGDQDAVWANVLHVVQQFRGTGSPRT